MPKYQTMTNSELLSELWDLAKAADDNQIGIHPRQLHNVIADRVHSLEEAVDERQAIIDQAVDLLYDYLRDHIGHKVFLWPPELQPLGEIYELLERA